MNKAELLKLPVLKPSKDIMETAKNDKPKIKNTGWTFAREEYQYTTYLRAKVFGDILKVAIFTRDDILREHPGDEIYISKNEQKYLTYNLISEKWRTAKIDRLNYQSYHPEERFYSGGTEKAITEYLDNGKKTGYEAVYQFQEDIATDKLERLHRKITDRIDSAMELVPQLPKDFERWAEITAMKDSRYIYYEYSRNVKEGWCTHCGKMVPIDKPKHNTEGTCRVCHSKITFKSIKKAAVVKDYGYATLIQRTKEGFIRRYFELFKFYNDYKKPEFTLYETVRTFLDEDMKEKATYEWAWFKNTKIMRWCIWETKAYGYSRYRRFTNFVHDSTLYTRNIKSILKGTQYQYSAIEIYAKHISRFQPIEYLWDYKDDKKIEYMVKMGLYRITQEYIKGYSNYFEKYATKPNQLLRVRKDQIRTLIEMDASGTELRVMQKGNEAGIRLTKEQIRWIAQNLGANEIIKYMQYSTPHKVIRYLKAQTGKMSDIASDYYDYLEFMHKLKYDIRNTFVMYPKNLKLAHDEAAEEWKREKDRIESLELEEKDKMMPEITAELEELFMENKSLMIRIPKTCREIKEEGQNLHHCVGTYIDRVLSKETAILFIRQQDKPEESFYTMEVRENRVVQVRGKNNSNMTKEVEKFVESFKKTKLQKREKMTA